jgi:hypothetical protein
LQAAASPAARSYSPKMVEALLAVSGALRSVITLETPRVPRGRGARLCIAFRRGRALERFRQRDGRTCPLDVLRARFVGVGLHAQRMACGGVGVRTSLSDRTVPHTAWDGPRSARALRAYGPSRPPNDRAAQPPLHAPACVRACCAVLCGARCACVRVQTAPAPLAGHIVFWLPQWPLSADRRVRVLLRSIRGRCPAGEVSRREHRAVSAPAP